MGEGVFIDLELENKRENANFDIPIVDYEEIIEKAEKFNEEVVEPTR